MKVLIVEDDELVRALMHVLLNEMSVEVCVEQAQPWSSS
jgi:hypothetical protein